MEPTAEKPAIIFGLHDENQTAALGHVANPEQTTSDLRKSYTATNSFPVKILRNINLMKSIAQKKTVIPFHVQLNPTNRWNFNYGFCSCASRDKCLEVPFEELTSMMETLNCSGAESVTVTGGGDPLLYSKISKLLWLNHIHDIDTDLVCNGSLLDSLTEKGELKR